MYLTTQELDIIREYFRTRPVLRVYLFGSYARGEATADSDVDLLVDLDDSARVGMEFFGWPLGLEELLGKRIDLGSADSILSFYRPFIEADKTLIYEQAVRRQAAA